MTPSNNPNGEPLIYRICDAAGVFHLVAPIDHHHSLDEIDGLAAALAAKANADDVQTALEGKQNALTFDTTPTAGSTNPVTSGGVKEAIDNHIVSIVTRDDFESGKYAQVFVLANGSVGVQASTGFGVALEVNGSTKWFMIEPDTIDNLIRASQSPDSTPTLNSDKLVTSGVVKAALDQKVDLSNFSEKVDRLDSFTTSDVEEKINLPTVFDDDHYSTTYIIENYTSEDRTLDSFFNGGSDYLVCEPNKIIHPDSYVIAKVIKYNNGNTLFFVVVEGIYEM